MHLESDFEMLPIFHTAGHLAYAKSAELYLLEMETLQDVLSPENYERYTCMSYFTIRRSSRFWSGVWTDMTIEQWVMKKMKGGHCFKAKMAEGQTDIKVM